MVTNPTTLNIHTASQVTGYHTFPLAGVVSIQTYAMVAPSA